MIIKNKNFPLFGPSRPALLGTLAALFFAAHCAGAPGTPALTGFTTSPGGPGGFIFDGTKVWVTDASLGLCRMDPAVGGGGGFTLSNCVLPPTNAAGVKAVLGQPAFDVATQFVYLPDMSTASKGIWRYSFNGSIFNTAVNIAATAGLGGQRPGAVTLGNDANLYATMSANSSFVRVNLPAGAAQTVDKMGTTVSGKPARGLTFVNTALWIADVDGELLIPGAALCATKCRGALNTQVGVPNPLSITWDAVNSYVYIGTSFGVFRHNRLDGQTVLYSKFWTSGAASGLLTNVTAVGLDNLGNLYYADDPTGSQTPGAATVYSVPAASAPDGQGALGSPAPTVPPILSAAPASANPALLYATGLTAPKGAVFMGTHVWVVDGAAGFCRVDPALPAPLTHCAVLPVGFVPGSPAYDKVSNQVYLADTTAAGQGIVKLPFTLATETVGAATTVVPNTVLVAAVAGSTAPTALAVGPDQELYAAMAGTNRILRVTTPAGATHKVTFIGSIFDAGSVSIAFHNSDLWAVETASTSILYNATLCQGNCTSLFFAQSLVLPTAVVSDGTMTYMGLAFKVAVFDPVANTFATMADSGLVNGVSTSFDHVTGLASDGLGHIFASDATRLWQIGGSTALPTVTSLAPSQAPEGSTKTVVITGSNFAPTSLVVTTCASGAITPGNVTVDSLTQITATFTINPVGPLGPCNITVSTAAGATAASAASSFTVLVGPAALTGVTPNSGFRGRTLTAVSIAGANMGGGAIDPIPGVTITNTAINAAGTIATANFAISATATLGPQNLTVTTPSGTSNILTFTIAAAPPVLTGIAPATGVANSTVAVSLTGTDLLGTTVDPQAGFTPSGVPVVTATSINASFVIASTVPAGPQSITVTGPGGTSNAMTFTILPNLVTIAPSSARAGDTTNLVTLTGTSLSGVTSITAANIVVTNLVATATSVTATFASAPGAPVGPVSVTVTDANGTSNAVTFQLIGPIPTIAGISQISGGTGATVPVTITGTGLTLGTLNLPVGVTVIPGTLVNNSFTQITATLLIAGNAPVGAQSISVTTPGTGNASNSVTFTVFALAPLLNANGIAPASAAAGSTVTVTLTGTGLAGTTSVNPSGTGIAVSSFTVVSGTQITATFVIATGASTQQISVTNPNGTSNSLTFGILPTLTSINPASSPAGVSVLVTLTGTSLTGATSIGTGTAGIAVTGMTVVSSTQITATFTIAANATPGVHNISVVTPGGTTGTVPFNVLPPPPSITSINAPFKRGSNQGVTLGGANFTGANTIAAVQVFLNGTAIPTASLTVTNFQTSATQLRWNWTIPNTAAFPASSGTQVYTIAVTTPSGTSAPFGFTVQ